MRGGIPPPSRPPYAPRGTTEGVWDKVPINRRLAWGGLGEGKALPEANPPKILDPHKPIRRDLPDIALEGGQQEGRGYQGAMDEQPPQGGPVEGPHRYPTQVDGPPAAGVDRKMPSGEDPRPLRVTVGSPLAQNGRAAPPRPSNPSTLPGGCSSPPPSLPSLPSLPSFPPIMGDGWDDPQRLGWVGFNDVQGQLPLPLPCYDFAPINR